MQPTKVALDLKGAMAGTRNLFVQAQQHGEGNIKDIFHPLSWELYEQMNKYFLMEGTEEGMFGGAFFTLGVKLAAWGKSTAQVCTSYFSNDQNGKEKSCVSGQILYSKVVAQKKEIYWWLNCDELSDRKKYFALTPKIWFSK